MEVIAAADAVVNARGSGGRGGLVGTRLLLENPNGRSCRSRNRGGRLPYSPGPLRRMVRMKRTVVLSATVIVVLLLAAPSYADVLLTGADWQMNETSGQMIDSSGNNNNGDPTDVRQRGSRYVFNGSTSYVLVPDSDSLDPQGKDITLRARVKVTDTPMDDDSYDVVRKGLAGRPGGDYKMEIKRAADPTIGKLHCLFKGDGGTVDKVARRDIVDG